MCDECIECHCGDRTGMWHVKSDVEREGIRADGYQPFALLTSQRKYRRRVQTAGATGQGQNGGNKYVQTKTANRGELKG